MEKIKIKESLTPVDIEKVDRLVNEVFERAPQDYPENIKRLVRQAIINLEYYVESEEFSQYCFPALRALEGHIKYLIKRSGGKVGRSFYEFNKDPKTGRYVFIESVRRRSEIPYIEKCYNYYKSVRDTTIHFGDLIGQTDSTRMIESKKDADEIIEKCISLIRWK